MIFVNSLPRSIELSRWLNEMGWKSGHIHAGITQDKRLSVMEDLRDFKLRLLVCSDLVSLSILEMVEMDSNLICSYRLHVALMLIESIW